jgi:hypothetical protein
MFLLSFGFQSQEWMSPAMMIGSLGNLILGGLGSCGQQHIIDTFLAESSRATNAIDHAPLTHLVDCNDQDLNVIGFSLDSNLASVARTFGVTHELVIHLVHSLVATVTPLVSPGRYMCLAVTALLSCKLV